MRFRVPLGARQVMSPDVQLTHGPGRTVALPYFVPRSTYTSLRTVQTSLSEREALRCFTSTSLRTVQTRYGCPFTWVDVSVTKKMCVDTRDTNNRNNGDNLLEFRTKPVATAASNNRLNFGRLQRPRCIGSGWNSPLLTRLRLVNPLGQNQLSQRRIIMIIIAD